MNVMMLQCLGALCVAAVVPQASSELCSTTPASSDIVQTSGLLQTSRQHMGGTVAVFEEKTGAHMIDSRHWLVGAILLLGLGLQVLEPMKQFAETWVWSMRSRGDQNGLPTSQRYCKDEVQNDFANWMDVIPCNQEPFILDTGGKQPLTFAELHDFAQNREVWLSRFGIGLTDRVSTMIPNGPEAAVCFLVFPLRCVYAPLNPAFTAPEIEFEFQDLPCHTVVVMAGEENSATLTVSIEQKVQVLQMAPNPNTAGLFSLTVHASSAVNNEIVLPQNAVEQRSARGDIALVLHTSGTTKKPKIVPLTHENLTVGALSIKSTLQRATNDVCLNLMPLYHIHGLSVNVLATAMSGASVACTPGYKGPAKPVEWLSSGLASWYSAVPTMHQGIVEAAISSPDFDPAKAGVELIRNCSAALVPVLADKMELLFRCVVMPTYAMSESMPIASNPLPPNLRVLRSVGKAAGPELVLRHEATNLEPKHGEEAEICVMGACVTRGYEMRAHMDQDPNIEAFTPDRWLRTGDKGYIDEHGYLCLSGRYKEIINRGGEKISPFEVENVCRQWPPIFDCIAFSCPHVQLGETVGLAAVLRDGEKMSSARLEELRQFGMSMMSVKWLPECLVFMQDIPKGSTGKPARIGLAKRMKLEALDVNVPEGIVVWDALSGMPTPITDSGDGGQRREVKTAVDSLGKIREVNDEKLEEMALVETLYGFSIPWILFFHMFLDYGSYNSIMGPFKDDELQLGHRVAMDVKPVTIFLVSYGYLEAADRKFEFGRFEREFLMAALVSFTGNLTPLYMTFLELITGHTYTGPGHEFEPFHPWFSEGSWFLEFVLIGRIFLVLLQKLHVPGWLQVSAACLASFIMPVYAGNLEKRTTGGEMMFLYAVLATGAHIAPPIVKHIGSYWKSASRIHRSFFRLGAAILIVASTFGPLGEGFSDATRKLCFNQQSMPPALCLPISLAQQVAWVGAVAVLLAPAVWPLRFLGSHALGAFVWGTPTFLFTMNGVSLLGTPVLPSVAKISEAFAGGGTGQSAGLVVSYIVFLYMVLYVNCLVAGYCFHTFVAAFGGAVGKAIRSLKPLKTAK